MFPALSLCPAELLAWQAPKKGTLGPLLGFADVWCCLCVVISSYLLQLTLVLHLCDLIAASGNCMVRIRIMGSAKVVILLHQCNENID